MISEVDIRDWEKSKEPIVLEKLKEGDIFSLYPWQELVGVDKVLCVINKTRENLIAESIKYFDTDVYEQKYSFPFGLNVEAFLWQKPKKK
jgi:hypothetical protein